MRTPMKCHPGSPDELEILDVFIKLILKPGSRMNQRDKQVVQALQSSSRSYQGVSPGEIGTRLHNLSVEDMKRTVNKVKVILHKTH
jgi:hypothetical protein